LHDASSLVTRAVGYSLSLSLSLVLVYKFLRTAN